MSFSTVSLEVDIIKESKNGLVHFPLSHPWETFGVRKEFLKTARFLSTVFTVFVRKPNIRYRTQKTCETPMKITSQLGHTRQVDSPKSDLELGELWTQVQNKWKIWEPQIVQQSRMI